jgi:hypothetical protein
VRASALRACALLLGAALTGSPARADDAARQRMHLAELHADQTWVDASAGAVDLFVRAVTTGGEPVVGIDPSNIEVLEDGKLVDSDRVEVTTLDVAKLGVAWVLVLDTSPTMQDAVPAMKEAARKFIDRADDWDDVAIVTIGADVTVAAPFKADRAALRQTIDGIQASLTPNPTRRNDAIDAAIGLIREADSQRRGVVVVFSDGGSDDSNLALETVAAHAKGEATQGQVLVYTVGFSTGFGDAGFAEMGRLAEMTTARHWQATDGTPVEDFYGDIWKHIRGSYVVRFQTDLDGAPHEVRIVVADKDASRGVLYPAVRRGVPGWVLASLAGITLAAGAFAGIRLRRTGRLVYKSGPEHGRMVRLKRGVNRIGQAGDNEIVIPHDTVSRRHAEIEVTAGTATLRDLESTNGTFVNEVAVEGSHRLANGDRVRIADVDLEYVR